MEKEISAKDSRFKLGEEFKEDIQVKPDMSIQAKLKVKRSKYGMDHKIKHFACERDLFL